MFHFEVIPECTNKRLQAYFAAQKVSGTRLVCTLPIGFISLAAKLMAHGESPVLERQGVSWEGLVSKEDMIE